MFKKMFTFGVLLIASIAMVLVTPDVGRAQRFFAGHYGVHQPYYYRSYGYYPYQGYYPQYRAYSRRYGSYYGEGYRRSPRYYGAYPRYGYYPGYYGWR